MAPLRQERSGGGRRDAAGALPALHGPRVTLRAVTATDKARLLQILAEPEVARWWRRDEWERVIEPQATSLVIETDAAAAVAAAGARPVAGRSARGPRLLRTIGLIQFHDELDEDYRHAGIDLFVSSEMQGRALGPEAIRVLVRYLIDVRGHHRFIIDPAVENSRAIAAYRAVGFRPVGVLRRYERVEPGVYADGLLMDLLAEELVE